MESQCALATNAVSVAGRLLGYHSIRDNGIAGPWGPGPAPNDSHFPSHGQAQ